MTSSVAIPPSITFLWTTSRTSWQPQSDSGARGRRRCSSGRAHDPSMVGAAPPPDMTIDRIGDLLNCNLLGRCSTPLVHVSNIQVAL